MTLTHDQAIELIAACRDGKQLQFRDAAGKWWSYQNPALSTILLGILGEIEIRIRPEPRRGFFPDSLLFTTRALAESAFPQAEIVEFVEVLP